MTSQNAHDQETENSSTFLWIAENASALAVAVCAMIIVSFDYSFQGFALRLTPLGPIAFCGGWLITSRIWKSARPTKQGKRSKGLSITAYGAVASLAMLSCLAWSLIGVPSDEVVDMMIGFSVVLFTLAIGGCMLLKVFRFLANESKQEEAQSIHHS